MSIKILCPVKNAYEMEQLYKEGATEFYCGFLPESWIEMYRDPADRKDMFIPINKREGIGDNVSNLTELKKMAQMASTWGTSLFVTMNRLNYPSSCYPMLEACMHDLMEANIRHLIVTDLGFIHWLKAYKQQFSITVSTCALVLNSWTSRLYADLGVKRVVVPRHMSCKELEHMCQKMPDMEFECFILDQGCQYDDGNCRVLHACSAICRDQWAYEYYRVDHQLFTPQELKNLYLNECYYSRWVKPAPSKDYRVNNWDTMFCTICKLPWLVRLSNLTSIKIAGREKTLADKRRLVRLTNEALTMAYEGSNAQQLQQYVQKNLGTTHCAEKQRCYMQSIDR